MDDAPTYWLGTQSLANLKPTIPLTENEWTELDRGVRTLLEVQPQFQYRLVERNFTHLLSSYRMVSTTLSLGRDFAPGVNRTHLGEAVMSAIVNWLTSMRMYLDHQETLMNRTFGKQSEEYKTFKLATAHEFDSEDGYRFAYKLRNYVQHCGIPLSNIRLSIPDPTTEPHGRQAVKLLVDRDELVNTFDGWARVRFDLLRMEPEFDLLPLLTNAMTSVRRINRTVSESLLDRAIKSAPVLLCAARRIGDDEGEPTIFKIVMRSDGTMTFSPRILQTRAASILAEIADGRLDRDTIWVHPNVDDIIPLDPTHVREGFSPQNRAVQAMLSWHHEGGATPAFLSSLDSIIGEDHGVERLVTELLNSSLILSNMLAIHLGTTSPALISGLADRYGNLANQGEPDQHHGAG